MSRAAQSPTLPADASLSQYLQHRLLSHDVIARYHELLRREDAKQQDTDALSQDMKQMLKVMKPIVETYEASLEAAIARIANTNFDVSMGDLLRRRDRESDEPAKDTSKDLSRDTLSLHNTANLSVSQHTPQLNIIQTAIFEYLETHLIPHMQKTLWKTSLLVNQRKRAHQRRGTEQQPVHSLPQKHEGSLSKSNAMSMLQQNGVEQTTVQLADWVLLRRKRRVKTVPTAELWVRRMRERQEGLRENTLSNEIGKLMLQSVMGDVNER